MARGIRLTKSERESLRLLIGPVNVNLNSFGSKLVKDADSILRKLLASEESPAGVNPGPIEEALIAAARGKVIALEGGYDRAARLAGYAKATPEQATDIGAWMARQGWLHGPQTIIDVLNKWHPWLAKARATAPPPALQPGLGTDAPDGRGPAKAGKAPAGGRSTPGFR